MFRDIAGVSIGTLVHDNYRISGACLILRGQEMPVSAGPPAGEQCGLSEEPTSSSGQRYALQRGQHSLGLALSARH